MSIIPKNSNEFQENLKKFTQHQDQSQNKLQLGKRYEVLGLRYFTKAERCYNCGSFLEFNLYQHKETTEHKRKLINANFCDVKWCPMCAFIKQRKFANEVRSILKQIEESYKVRYIFLTLTIKNPPMQDLRDTLKSMYKSFNKLTKSKEFKSNVLGFIRATEVLGDDTKQGEAHPHFHCLLVVKSSYFSHSYMPQAKWSELWQRCLQVDYMPVVDVRAIKAKSEKWSNVDSATFETLKYQAKPTDLEKLNPANFEELDKQMHGVRQYSLGGLCKKIKPKKEYEFKKEQWDLLGREIYKWLGLEKKYSKIDFTKFI